MKKRFRNGIAACAVTALLLGGAIPANAIDSDSAASASSVAEAAPVTNVNNIPLEQNDLALGGASVSALAEELPPASSRAALPDDDVVVEMPDVALRAAVLKQVGGGSTLTRGKMRLFTSLTAQNAGITDLTGLEYASSLRIVDLRGNSFPTIEPLRGLANIAQLNVSSSKISDIDAVSTMPQINYLQFNWTTVADIEPLRGKDLLWRVEMAGTKVASLDPLRDIPALIELYFQETPVSDLSPLAERTKLITLSAPNTEVADLTPLAGFPNLQTVNVNGARVSDLSMLGSWPKLSNVGFLNQRVAGAAAVASQTETTYRRPVATTAPFKMRSGVVLTTSVGATTTPEGITVWSPLAPDATELTTKVAGDPGPGSGATYSATLTYPLTHADFTNAPRTAAVNKPYNFQLAVTDGFVDGPFQLVSGEVPGLTLSDAGVITGTPTELGSFPITVARTDAYGNTITRAFTLLVAEKADTFTVKFDSSGGSAVQDIDGVEYGDSVAEPTAPTRAGYTFTGWTLDDAAYDFSAPVTANITLTAKWTVEVPEVVPPVIKPGTLPEGIVGRAYAATITATGSGTPVLSISGGTLPSGVKFDAKTGKLSGTPTKVGSFTFTVKADAAGVVATKAYTIVVSKDTVIPPCIKPRQIPVFADTPLSHKFYKEIDWMECMKYSTGWRQPSGKPLYKPQNNLERQAMAAFIYRMEAPKNYKAPKVSPFADVKPGDSFYKEIAWMYESKLSTGYREAAGKPTFRPHASLTREAMAAFIYRLEAPKNYTAPKVSPMADMKPGMSFYKEISWMYSEKLSTGNRVGATKEYWPKDDLSRQAMAAFIYRLVLDYRPGK
ncbi:hypothetical protein G7068_11150 [Leucobacter viscericola]|uniref:SLH domain-containing protein n=1 Tax=Leucobacter viscericola TaxID=2714935 RepID=A0A6G7XGK9_9MICO|nr:putative Ig domain-containing protein [Leucobacter viscericola]QIK63683.1 hypothetical protein G7068_11150 [Leucobacter viscericola]